MRRIQSFGSSNLHAVMHRPLLARLSCALARPSCPRILKSPASRMSLIQCAWLSSEPIEQAVHSLRSSQPSVDTGELYSAAKTPKNSRKKVKERLHWHLSDDEASIAETGEEHKVLIANLPSDDVAAVVDALSLVASAHDVDLTVIACETLRRHPSQNHSTIQRTDGKVEVSVMVTLERSSDAAFLKGLQSIYVDHHVCPVFSPEMLTGVFLSGDTSKSDGAKEHVDDLLPLDSLKARTPLPNNDVLYVFTKHRNAAIFKQRVNCSPAAAAQRIYATWSGVHAPVLSSLPTSLNYTLYSALKSALFHARDDVMEAAQSMSMRTSQFTAAMERLRRVKPGVFTFADSRRRKGRSMVEYSDHAMVYHALQQKRRRTEKQQKKEMQKVVREVYEREREQREALKRRQEDETGSDERNH